MKLNKKIMLVLSMAIMTLSIFLSDMQVMAANVYYVPYAEPSADTNSGYCIVETSYANGARGVTCFFWYIYFMKPSGEGIENSPTDCGMVIGKSGDTISFTPSASPSYSLVQGSIAIITGENNLRIRKTWNGSSVESYSYDYNTEGADIVGLIYKGNVVRTVGFSGYELGSIPQIVFNSNDSALALQQILTVLLRMDNRDGQVSSLLQTYIPRLSNIDLDLDVLLDLTENIIDELSDANSTLDSIDSSTYNTLVELKALHTTIKNQSSTDKNVTDGFKQDSDSQSNQLNNLNQQSQPDKIDVNNASGVVDQNLNINTDANYGVLLSTFTSNGKILTMLLAVSSIGLISYVLFGKR